VPLPDRTLHFPATVNTIKDETGKVILNLTHAADITELKKIQKALAESHQFSSQIIASEQEGIIVFDWDLHYRVWNPFMEKITGAPAPQVIGKHISELFPFPSILAYNLIKSSILGLTQDQLFGKKAMDPNWHFIQADGLPMLPNEYPFNPGQTEITVNIKVGLATPVDEALDPIKKLKILIAEDDEAYEFFITTIVKKISQEVLSTTSGLSAVEISRNNPELHKQALPLPGRKIEQ